MTIYKAKKSISIYIFLLLFFILFLIILFYSKEDQVLNFIIASIPLILLIWIILSTKYKIQEKNLHYRSGFIKGKININEIKEITIGKTKWSGLKPALATNGLIIKYNFEEIYIAPIKKAEILKKLLSINPNIKVKE
ncbi:MULTISPECIES: PH domain-containing protein [Mesonia]|uniref:Uncharacterized protein n=1 Tax=Mesonia oceanica TaxID=2687242 RepID=A0AC61YAF4_9FLAO|nr:MULTISPECIES: PH domain-containing protein [Mesonia]MAN27481.1 hypothetical protein [Mesonia sp.]MAQ42509.1 hypothetical protein [Mesonia sp.]MBJ96873.1 hypothetical protein [Flavobacteriaceae bacterium]VVV01484.1 hypothetical protein FVB9532_02776 [Mesonia oceanica]|tara:strand:+ start:3134 stop:3544 length:411 start_codon:yes stop_codon:yes gene_type:complete